MGGITNAPQKIVCAKDLPCFVLRDQIVRAHLCQIFVTVLRMRQPDSSVKIAEPARGLLNIGLLETDCFSELKVAGIALLQDGGEKGLYPPAPIFLQSLLQRVMESLVSGQEASVYCRGSQVQIVKGRGNAITHRAKTMTNGQSGIPQHLQKICQHRFHLTKPLAAVENKEINVRVGRQLSSSIAADRQQSASVVRAISDWV